MLQCCGTVIENSRNTLAIQINIRQLGRLVNYHFSTSMREGTLDGSLWFALIFSSRLSSSNILNHSLLSSPAPLCSCAVSARNPHEDGVCEFRGYTRSVGTYGRKSVEFQGNIWRRCRPCSRLRAFDQATVVCVGHCHRLLRHYSTRPPCLFKTLN